MSFVSIMRLNGDADELLKVKQEQLDPIAMQFAEEFGALHHIVAKTDDGLTMINIWETSEGADKMAEKVMPLAQAAGQPRPTVEHYEIAQWDQPRKIARV